MSTRFLLSSLLLCLSVIHGGFDAAFGQDDLAPEGDIPEWLEGYGYRDDVSFDGVSAGASFDRGVTSQDAIGSDWDSANLGSGIGSCDDPGCDGLGIAAGPCQCGSLACRRQLMPDWFGFRKTLQESGITYRGRMTQFFFGVGGGVNEPVPPQFSALGIAGGDQFEYTGNTRHDWIVDLDRFGGLPHSKFIFTTESVWGRWGNVSFETGGLSPAIFNAAFPVDLDAEGIPRVTNFLLVQPLSENFIVTVGKTRTIGVADNNIFAGGDGSDQFLNQTFVANPLMVPQIPFSTFVIGAVIPQEWGNIGISVMDPLERSTEFMEFDNLFAEGAILFGQLQIDTHFFNKPGEHHIGGFYKNADLLDLTFTPLPPTYPYPPAPDGTPAFQTKSETYALFYGFDQYVTTFPTCGRRGATEGWGVFGRASLADGGTGNPNFGAWHASLGIGGDSPLRHRRGKGDRFGIGYGYTATSTEFGPIPQALFAPRDAQVIEAYYRYRLAPAIEVTPDIQWIKGMLSGLTGGDDAIVAGIRLNLIL